MSRAPHKLRVAFVGALSGFALAGMTFGLLLHYGAFDRSSSSTLRGSGVASTQTRRLPAFEGVELAGSNDVVVHRGAKQSVVVYADSNLLSKVTTRVEGRTLVIGNTPGSFETKSPMRVEVTTPSVTALSLSGSGVVFADGIEAAALTARLDGSGVLRASGSAGRLDVALAGSGDAQLQQVVAKDVHAVVSGSGRILVTATGSLEGLVPGSGAIMYSGAPAHVTTSNTGSGAVIPTGADG
jgi:hypothetical protein